MCSEYFQLNKMFSDNMILQRNKEVPIWGTAEDGTIIKVEFCGQIKSVKALNGNWKVTLSNLKAGGPFELKVSSNIAQVTLHNILVGDVWIAGGQSNMEFNLKDSLDGDKEIENANYFNIRYYYVPKIAYEGKEVQEQTSEWQVCSPASAGGYSAVAYYFAKKVHIDLNVPIGIINCNWGGTSAASWIDREYLIKDKELKVYLDEYNEYVKTLNSEEYEKQIEDYQNALDKYNNNLEVFKRNNPGASSAETDKALGPFPWPPPMGPKSYRRPNGLYNTMFKKVVPYAVKGIIWYQGEEDAAKPKIYEKLFSRVIENWRRDYDDEELPFLFVQLPAFGDSSEDNWARVREAQFNNLKRHKKTGMVVSFDFGEADNVHPKNKMPVGERLAVLALGKVYGKSVEYSGPLFKSMQVVQHKAIIEFTHVGQGLCVNGDRLKGFEVCDKSGIFKKAQAAVVENKVEVWNEEVEKPEAVRYGWFNYGEINLYNKDGLEASPFRTDNF